MKKLTPEQVTHIKRYLRSKQFSMRAIAREYGVTVGAIQSIARGRSHKDEPSDQKAISLTGFARLLLRLAAGEDLPLLCRESGLSVRALRGLEKGFVVRAGGLRLDVAKRAAQPKKVGAVEAYETQYRTWAALDYPDYMKGDVLEAWLALSYEEKKLCKAQKIAIEPRQNLLPSPARLR
jgi:transcriptional regulator with XRE-family HTH domain